MITKPPVLDAAARARLVSDRVETLRELIARHGAAGILLDSRRDFAWLTLGGQNHILYTTEAGVAPILVTQDDAVVFAPVNEFDRVAEEEVHGLPLRVESTPWSEPRAATEHARRAVAGGQLVTAADVADDLVELRCVLTKHEHVRLEWLADVVLDVVNPQMTELGAGQTEDEVVARVAAEFAARAVRLPVVLVAADERIERYRHPLSASKAIERRVMLVVVAERWGLHVAYTQFRELEPLSATADRSRLAVLDVLAEMRNATVPGNTLGDVLAAARAAYADNDMADEWTLHHQGGTIGYGARERIATPGDSTVIKPGMAFAWNPSAVGYKVEETLYLDDDGGQHILTTTPGLGPRASPVRRALPSGPR